MSLLFLSETWLGLTIPFASSDLMWYYLNVLKTARDELTEKMSVFLNTGSSKSSMIRFRRDRGQAIRIGDSLAGYNSG